MVAIFEGFCQRITQPRVVVLDNAPAHRGKAFQAKVHEWARQDLHLLFLPAYSPELNRIEVLWKKIKHEWLEFKAYLSFESLQLNLRNVLDNIGSTYTINFV